MSLENKIDKTKLPKHIAIIMDGNGRWAKKKGEVRLWGHRNGVKSVRKSIELAAKLQIKYLTLYAFSSENWSRPQDEVKGLMKLFIEAIERETPKLIENNIRLKAIGDTSRFSATVQDKLNTCIKETAKGTGLTVILALSYSGQWDITQATQKICQKVKDGEQIEIDKETIDQHLSTSGIPDPELMIRTSGEKRISNFLLWQIAYSELYFTDINWPDFSNEEFYKALYYYQNRERRFGKTSEQL